MSKAPHRLVSSALSLNAPTTNARQTKLAEKPSGGFALQGVLCLDDGKTQVEKKTHGGDRKEIHEDAKKGRCAG